MSTTSALRPAQRRRHASPPGTVVTLAVLLALLAVGAFQGGIAMVVNPVDPLGMSPDYLVDSPVSSYLWPGLFLLGLAVASLVAIPGLVFGWDWPWASSLESSIGYRWPWVASVAIGSTLLGFELIELVMVPFHPIMHPLLIGWSLAILVLVTSPTARKYLRAA